MSPVDDWKNEHSRQKGQQNQRPWGGAVLGTFRAQPGKWAGVKTEGGRRWSKGQSAQGLLPRGLNRTIGLTQENLFHSSDWRLVAIFHLRILSDMKGYESVSAATLTHPRTEIKPTKVICCWR